MWTATLVTELARRGHPATLVVIETPDYMRGRFHADAVATYELPGGARLVYTATPDVVGSAVADADAVIIRHDYERLAEFVDASSLAERVVVQILCGAPKTGPFFPLVSRRRILVNGDEEVEAFRRAGVVAEIFLKPAAPIFYEWPADRPRKRHDVAFIAWDTGRPQKRFGLLLDGLEALDHVIGRPLSTMVVGGTSSHRDRLAALTGKLRHVTIQKAGQVDQARVRQVYHESRLTVMPSRVDFNPQVIAESLACDVPVACARDLTGGRFQITPDTGELFDPEPAALAETLRAMLGRLDRYRPRAHGVTPADAVEQIERIVGELGDGRVQRGDD
jgi:glycosyltransferase involved in cell wall biosynthesis